MKKLIGVLLTGGLGLLLLIQLVPYGRDHSNPAVRQEYSWPSAEAQAVAQRSCYDCHSHRTTWPWYSNIAPVSWLVQRDVEEGRAALNFSNWQAQEQETDEVAEVLRKGKMPMPIYLLTHPSARLTSAEVTLLIESLGSEAEED